jgi:non-specific protein-tyrosine kinase
VNLLEYLRIVGRRWPLITAYAVLGIGAAVLVTVRTTPQYVSSTTLYVSSADATASATSAYEATLLAQQQVQSYANILTSGRIAGQVAAQVNERANNRLSPAEVQAEVAVNVIPQTALLRATVTDPSPERAQLIAQTLGPTFAAAVTAIERPAPGGSSPVKVSVVDDATRPGAPASPRPVRNLTLGLLAGLFAGVAVAVLRDVIDTTLKSSDELRETTGGPVLATVVTQTKAQQEAIREHRPPYSESYRLLRTNLQFVKVDEPLKAITVTSSVAGEGKSFTTCNLALALAHADKRVILVDADLRHPRACEYLGLRGRQGLTSVLAGNARLDDALIRSKNHMLTVLPSGPIPPNPSELLGSVRMLELLEQLKERADMVVIDSPPLLPVADAAILAHISDGAILVALHGKARRENVARSIEQLNAVDAKLLGSVLNKVPSRVTNINAYEYYGFDRVDSGLNLSAVVGTAAVPQAQTSLTQTSKTQPGVTS